MPGFYPDDEYDLAGFAVGIVDRNKIIDGKKIKAGDKLIGLASSGLHSNGFSLVRKLLNISKQRLLEHVEVLGCRMGDELLKPTKIYVKTILDLKERYEIKGISHITGGGFIENIPRMVPEGLRVRIQKGQWPILPIFGILQSIGDIKDEEIFNTFNMGIGMVIAVDAAAAESITRYLNKNNEQAYIIGEIIKGDAGVEIC